MFRNCLVSLASTISFGDATQVVSRKVPRVLIGQLDQFPLIKLDQDCSSTRISDEIVYRWTTREVDIVLRKDRQGFIHIPGVVKDLPDDTNRTYARLGWVITG